jgi:hypothetical protein
MLNYQRVDDLPFQNGGSFHSYVKVFQRVCCGLIRIRLLGCRNLADFWSLLMMLLVELSLTEAAK